LIAPFVDLCLDVVHLGRGVGFHFGPFASCAIGGLTGLLLCVLTRQVRVDLGLVDALFKLVTGFAGGGLHRRCCLGDALLESLELRGEVHFSSIPNWAIPDASPYDAVGCRITRCG
jgi:hypothetical protein